MRSKFHVKKAVLISYCLHFHRKQIHLPYGPVATRAIRNSNLICDLFDIKYRYFVNFTLSVKAESGRL